MNKVIKGLFLVMASMVFAFTVQAGERVHEKEGGFSYDVLDHWRSMEYPGLKYKVVITDPIDNFSPNITVVDEVYSGDLKTYEEANIPTMESTIPGFKIIKQWTGKTTSGQAYRVMEYEHKADVGIIRQAAFFLKLQGERKLVMTCTMARGHEKRLISDCEKTVKSVRLD